MPNATTLRITTSQPDLAFHVNPTSAAVAKNGSVTLDYAPGSFPNLSRAQVHVFRQGAGSFLGANSPADSPVLQTIGAHTAFSFTFDDASPFTWIVCGDATTTQPYLNQIGMYSIQDFLAPGVAIPGIAALRLEGCIIITLTPQTDPNPPHNVHPIINTQGTWDVSNPYLSILNAQKENVDLFVRYFDSAGNASDTGPINFATPFNAYHVNLTHYRKMWYGFANHGVYTTAADYFTAHPYDGGSGHHTQQIPQGN